MSFEKNCKFCGKSYFTNRYTSLFCSASCYYKNKRAESNERRLQEIREKYPEADAYLNDGFIFYRKICQICNKKFESLHIEAKYCCEKCNQIARNRLMKMRDEELKRGFESNTLGPQKENAKVCEYCGRPFISARSSAHFCSNECYLKDRKDKALKAKLQECLEKEPESEPYIKDGYLYFQKKCIQCGATFDTIKQQARFCSDICQNKYQIQQNRITKQRQRQLRELQTPELEFMKGKYFKFSKTCEWCGLPFVARKQSTRFCSHACAEHFRRKQLNDQREHRLELELEQPAPVPVKEFMRIEEAARYLCICKSTLYRLIREGHIHYVHNGGISLITRDAILEFVKKCQCSSIADRPLRESKIQLINPVLATSQEFMSITQVAEFYDMDLVYVRNALHKSKLPFERVGKVKFYLKKDVERFIKAKKKAQHPEISKWYTVGEIMEKFNMTRCAVYQFINARKGIPTKKIGQFAYYSQEHVDKVCQKKEIDMNLYYTAQQASELAGANLNRLYKLLRRFGIPKVTIRGKIYIPKKELDAFMELNAPQNVSVK